MGALLFESASAHKSGGFIVHASMPPACTGRNPLNQQGDAGYFCRAVLFAFCAMKIFFVQQGILPCLQVQNRRILDGMKNTANDTTPTANIQHYKWRDGSTTEVDFTGLSAREILSMHLSLKAQGYKFIVKAAK
jgi:hypothetical protein